MERKKVRKLEFLKFSLIKLIQETLRKKEVEKYRLIIAFSLDKVILYPFFISTANGIESRKKMFRYVFTDFDDNKYGLFEVDVKDAFIEILNEEAENAFFPYFSFENLPEKENINENDFSDIFLIPNFRKIEECNVEEICVKENLGFDRNNVDVVEIIPHLVKNILNTYPEFLTFDINLLQELSSYYKSWDVQKIWVDKTDFDALEDVTNDIRFEIFTSENEFNVINNING